MMMHHKDYLKRNKRKNVNVTKDLFFKNNISIFDYHIDSDEEEQKFEVYTKTCSNAVG